MITSNTPSPAPCHENELRNMFGGYLDVDVQGLHEMAAAARKPHPHPPEAEQWRLFKEELRHAIDHAGVITPAIYEKWTGSDDYPTQEAVQEHLEEIWDACYNPEGSKVLLKSYIKGSMNPADFKLDSLAQYCSKATGGLPLECTQFFKGELRHALDHPGFITPALYQKWSTEPMPDQAAVQHRLQEMWDKCFGYLPVARESPSN